MGIIKKKSVSENIWDFSFGLLGESGIGKTTTMVNICETIVGEDGYAILNTGKEQGVDCLEGVAYVDIPTYKHFDAAVKEFVKNKKTEYPNLKILVIDTLDQLIEITEPESVRLWNIENKGKKDFIDSKTLNSSWGGFGRGEDKVIQIILDKAWELKKVGITCWFTMHTKTREQVDPLTNGTYTILSTNMMQKYFNAFKTKIHICGIACIDRTIEVQKTGRKNVVTKKDVTVNKVTESRRKVIFRDDNYGVDSKSRFAGIVEEVNLDADEIIQAIKDAIAIEKSKVKKQKVDIKKQKVDIEKVDEVDDENLIDENENMDPLSDLESDPLPESFDDILDENDEYPENLHEEVGNLFKACKDDNVKKEVRNVVKTYKNFKNTPEEVLKELYDKLK